MRVSVCLRAILIPEYLDFHSGYSAPRSRIAGMYILEYILIPEYLKPVCPYTGRCLLQVSLKALSKDNLVFKSTDLHTCTVAG